MQSFLIKAFLHLYNKSHIYEKENQYDLKNPRYKFNKLNKIIIKLKSKSKH